MLNKNLRILSIILLLLIVLLAGKIYWPQLTAKKSGYNLKIAQIKKDEVKNITISKDKDSLSLENKSGQWLINNHHANNAKVEELINQLLPTEQIDLISNNADKHKDFQVAEDNGTKIKLDDKLSLILGKSSFPGIYVRIDPDPQVYLLKNFTSSNLSTAVSFWQDKKIVEIAKNQVKKLIFSSGGKDFVLAKDEEKWKIENQQIEPNSSKLDSLLLTLSSFMATTIAEPDQIDKYPKQPSLTLKISHDNSETQLEFYQGKEDYLVKGVSDEEYFTISTSTAEKFTKASIDLLSPTASP